MRLLLDECISRKRLAAKLRDAGHEVVRSVDALGHAVSDNTIFSYAKGNGLAIVTFDFEDFSILHDADCDHAGILFIYRDDDANEMTSDAIHRAIQNVEATYPDGIRSMTLSLREFLW